MSTKWEAQNRTPKKRADAHFTDQTRSLGLCSCVDPVFITGAVTVLIILICSCLAYVAIGDYLGRFDAPLTQLIADERILENIRDDIANNPLLDTVMHKPDGRVYISQKGGTIHRYNPLTELWSSEKPFSTSDPITSDFIRLRSGCGADPLSDRAEHCPDAESLWAISANHGLARRTDGDWEIVVSDTMFVGAGGTPIENDELTAAAVSPDHRWLVVGTKNDGVGIYDIERRLWVHNGQEFFGDLPSLSVTHIAWWQGRFWIGSPSGLISLEIDDATPRLVEIPDTNGRILDLDADPDDALWILEQRDCEESGDNCLWLGKLQHPDQKPVVLIDERNLFPDLNLGNLTFAQYRGNQLDLAGEAGIFSYDTMTHTWERHFEGSVTAVLSLPDGNGFYFGFTGGVGVVEEDRLETWQVTNERIVKLLYGWADEVLILTAAGNVFSLNSKGKVSPVFQGTHTAFDPERFTSAVAVGDTVLFVGPEGALLHNISNRSYEDVPIKSLPLWLRNPDIQLINSGNYVYVLSPSRRGRLDVYTLPADEMARADYFAQAIKDILTLSVPGPVQRVWNWGDQGIGFIAKDGSVYRFTPQRGEMLTGPAVPEMDYLTFADVAALDQELVVATDRGLVRYDHQARAWSGFSDVPADRQAVEIDTFDGRILIRTDRGRLVQVSSRNPVLIGDRTGFEITDHSLGDARAIDQLLYLAGEGWVERYDPALRRITKRWELPGNGPVELKGVIEGQPLALSRDIATIGETIIDAKAGPVTTLSADDQYIWTVRDDVGQRYLKGYPIGSVTPRNAHCFFRNPSAGDAVTQILDARPLPGGTIAVATDAGLRFYNPRARSWFAGPSNLIPDGGRLYIIGEDLVLSEPYQDSFRLSFIPIDSIEIPHSCSINPVSLQSETITVRAVSIDEQSGRVAWIRPNEAIIERRLGQEREILPPTSEGPPQATLRRVYNRSNHLLFTTDKSIWLYDLSKRHWSQIALIFEPPVGSIADINIERQDGLETVIARSEVGDFYLGSTDAFTSSLNMKRILVPTALSFNAPADALLDVQDRGPRLWTFVLDDRIKYFDPVKREWHPDVKLGGLDRLQFYYEAAGWQVAVGNEGRVWWVGQDSMFTPRRFARYEVKPDEMTALDSTKAIWGLTPGGGTLWKCLAPFGGDYKCDEYARPFILDPQEVKYAFSWQNLVLFRTDKGLRALEPSLGNEIALPPVAAEFSGVTLDRIFNWLRHSGLVSNEWPRLRRNTVRLQNGRWAYDPITALMANEQGELVAVKPSGNVQLARRGTTDLELPPALDTGWLRWDRSRESFVVASPSGSVTIAKDEFIADNRLLFETVDAILAESPKRLYVANQYGVWRYNQPNLSLNDRTIKYWPIQLAKPIEAAHGRFMTREGDFVIGEDHLQQADTLSSVSFGDVTIWERIRKSQVSAEVIIGSARHPAFSDRGFVWDLGRRGLAYSDDGLFVQSKAGIHPVDAFTNFDPGPNRLARHTGTLHFESGSGLFFVHDGTWYKREPTGWAVGVDNPVANRILIDNSTWRWTLQNNRLDIKLVGPPHNFACTLSRDGYSFSSDRLLDATVHDNQLHVMTEAFFEVATQLDELATLTASRLPPRLTDRLETINFANGSSALFHQYQETVSRWDTASSQFTRVSASDNPYRRHLLVETDRLRFTGYPDRVVKELRIKDIAGNDTWVPFDFVDKQFPFDIVTSIAAVDNELYVGTAAGLQIYSGSLSTGLDDIDSFYDLRGQSGGSLVAVSQVGVPRDDPDLVMARSHADCIERRAGGPFTPCRDPGLLDWRLRAETHLWHWVTDPNGKIIGQYRDNQGSLAPDPIRIAEGRFPHDQLQDVVVCNQRTFSMWKSGWITVYPDNSIQLDSGIQNYPLEDTNPQRFICIKRDVSLIGATIPRGLYYEGRNQRIWHFSGTLWTEVTDPELVSGLLDRAARPPIIDRKRIRLLPLQANEDLHFEQRTLNGQWLPLPWQSGRVAVDLWRELLFLDDRLWAATPVGLVAFSRDANGQAVLDADSVIVVREPIDQQGICEITDLNIENKAVLARCDADGAKVYRGHLDGQQDTGVFNAFAGADPFAEQELVSEEATGFWQWRLTGREGGNPGSLVGMLRQEDTQLVGGRFDFDTINSAALFEAGLLEIGTEAGGWFQTPRESLHVRDLQRPRVSEIDPTTVNGVGITRVGEERLLCLRKTIGDYMRLAANEAPERIGGCLEYLGDDGFWRYMKEDELLSIVAPNSIGGVGVRHLEAGRFADDVVIGLPVTGEDSEGIFYLLPTQAGVLRLDNSLKSFDIHVPPFAGLPNDAVPDTLFMIEPKTPIYAGHSTFHNLDDARELVANIKLDAPDNAVLEAVEDGPQNLVRIRWMAAGKRGWNLVRQGDFMPLPPNCLYVNVSNFGKFTNRVIYWGNPEPWLKLCFSPGSIDAAPIGATEPYRLHIDPFNLILPILSEERLLLIEPQELRDVNLEKVVTKAFDLSHSPQARATATAQAVQATATAWTRATATEQAAQTMAIAQFQATATAQAAQATATAQAAQPAPGSPTPTPTYSPVPPTPQPPDQCREVISNGGFETHEGWTIPHTVYDAGYTDSMSHSGMRSMRLGIEDTSHNVYSFSSVEQGVTIPVNASVARLSFWYRALRSTTDGGDLADRDYGYVLARDAGGGWRVLSVIRQAQANWIRLELDLLPFAGQTMGLHFGVRNDGQGAAMAIYLDDVSLQVCRGTAPPPTPIPTATPTPSATPTAQAVRDRSTCRGNWRRIG